MRFLVDNALSPSIAEGLSKIGHDAVHVHTLGMAASSDDEILAVAGRDNRIILSADTDFGTLLTLREASHPSFILFRRTDKHPASQLKFLMDNLPAVENDLLHGAIVVLEDSRIRVRPLPLSDET